MVSTALAVSGGGSWVKWVTPFGSVQVCKRSAYPFATQQIKIAGNMPAALNCFILQLPSTLPNNLETYISFHTDKSFLL
jgi:hypothetical protein